MVNYLEISLNESKTLLAMLLSFIAACFAIFKYFETKKDEFKKEFWSKRYENYELVLNLASKITVSEDLNSVKEEINEYRQYYWGKLAMIEDQTVYEAMKEFDKKLKYYEGSYEKDFTSLQNKMYDLARACRLSLKNTWEPIDLDDLN